MAIIQNPVIGRARKQAGGMVFSKMYDKNVMRAKPAQVTPSNTPKQQVQRLFIALLTQFIKALSPDNLITLYPFKPAQRSRYSEFQHQLAAGRKVTDTTSEVDFEEIPFIGNGPTNDMTELTFDTSVANIAVEWNVDDTNSIFSPDSLMSLLAFNKNTKESVFIANFATYGDGGQIVPYPSGWTNAHSIEVYVMGKTVKFKPGSELSSNCKRAAAV